MAVYFEHKITTLVVGALLGATVTSCADQDFDWEAAKSQNPEYVFRSNFEKLVGEIDPNQSWDFSTVGKTYATRSEANGITVSDGTISKTFTSAFRKAVSEVLPEPPRFGTRDHYKKGTTYALYAQEGGFDIYPIWHGQCMQWTLKVNGEEVATYDKIMEKMGNASVSYGVASTDNDFTTTGWHIDAPVNTPIFIQLVITKSNTGNAYNGQYAKNGDVISSIQEEYTVRRSGKQVKINYGSLSLKFSELEAKGQTVASDFLTKIIMFEDSNTSNSDTDFNDFILGIYGNVTEQEIIVEDEKIKIPYSKSKRYMVEDLGSTASTDIDFNDLVVDLISTQNGYCEKDASGYPDMSTWEADPESPVIQTAQVRAMGGTLDFEFLVGGTPIFKKSEHLSDFDGGIEVKTMYNTTAGEINYDAKYEIDLAEYGNPWSPTDNNVSFRVWRGESSSHSVPGPVNNEFPESPTSEFSFPTPGSVPYIIAFDPSKKWRKERQKICSHFLYGTLDGENECDICGTNDTDYKVEGE